MSKWYTAVVNDKNKLPDFIIHFENELEQARLELGIKGKPLERHAAELPGMVEQRFSQLQEIEAVLEYLNIELSKMRSKEFKKFLESYAKALSSRDAEKYVDGVQVIVDQTLLVNEVALLRNKYLAVVKGFETKNFMISNVTRLRVAGLDDAQVS